MSTGYRCPYCGKDFDTHAGSLCPLLDAAMTKQLRSAVAVLQDERDEKIKQLAESSAITPRRYALSNAAGGEQLVLGFNLQRGIAVVYNDDAGDVFLGEDRQHVADATKQFVVKTKTGISFSSPNELWAIGGAAGPQNVYVLELPPGRQASEFAALFKLA